ncbi:hypothetical protein [Streptomyces sp. NPDC001492]
MNRALCTLYLAASAWLIWCTAQTSGHAPFWHTALNAAASVVLLAAFVQQLDLRDARRHIAVLHESAARKHEAFHGRPLTQLEAFMWEGLAEQLTEPDDHEDAA